jgi:adenine specific DNA methylase Mod
MPTSHPTAQLTEQALEMLRKHFPMGFYCPQPEDFALRLPSEMGELRWPHEGLFFLGGNFAGGEDRFLCPDLRDRLERAWGSKDLPIPFEEVIEREQERIRNWLRPPQIQAEGFILSLDRLPKDLQKNALRNSKQRAAWKKEGLDFPEKEKPECLLVESHFFMESWGANPLSKVPGLKQRLDGILIHGENSGALRLLLEKMEGKIQCIYMDPPFNTSGEAFAYRDRFPVSSWLSFLDERLGLLSRLMRQDGTLYAHIDYTSKERLRLLLERHLRFLTEIIWRVGWVSGFKTKANKFIRNHETIYQFGKSKKPLFNKQWIPYPEDYRRRDGNKPRGKGFPLEDTWNCHEGDQLHSIQIMSFSKEKRGDRGLTQKNENLLARMIKASSNKKDWVMDPFLGSGTTTAAAHKLGRKWIGIEHGKQFQEHCLPRMKAVLQGDPYGISKESGFKGGGSFRWLELKTQASTTLVPSLFPPK